MLKLIDGILQQFRICFKREETFGWFIVIIIGTLLRTEMRGITTIISCLGLEPRCYESLIHFFRSSAYDLGHMKSTWQKIVLKHIKPVMMDDYIMLVGDHIKVSKEARHMPGVKKLHQDSENAGKAEYIYGPNTVAYKEPQIMSKRGRGRPRKYGEKVTFKQVFKEMMDSFETASLKLYGKEETVRYLCMDLIWKPFGRKLRFVLVKTGEKCMILMCSDLDMHPGVK